LDRDSFLIEADELLIKINNPDIRIFDATIVFNGQPLTVPLENCAERLVEDEYATCKLIEVPSDLVRESNTIHIAFPDGHKGAVGAVVLRAGFPVPLKANNEP